MTDICLVTMPFGSIVWPSVGVGTLIAAAKEEGLSIKGIYATLTFADKIGIKLYTYLFELLRPESMLAEWIFSSSVFPDFEPDNKAYLSEINKDFSYYDLSGFLTSILGEKGDILELLLKIRLIAAKHIDETAQNILDMKPKIVGCSSTLHQNCASLALLKKIKEYDPAVVTMLGGANCEGEMGTTAAELFDFVDYVISGDADIIFPELCKDILQKNDSSTVEYFLKGVFCKDNVIDQNNSSTGCGRWPVAMVKDVDSLPVPDYDDFFEMRDTLSMMDVITPTLLVEGSRGCWKGKKEPCTFCGLNKDRTVYRFKSPGHITRELNELNRRYGVKTFIFTDVMINRHYYSGVFPTLSEAGKPYNLFVESTSLMEEWEVKSMADAGVTWMQPGIESLHDGLIKVLQKGNSAIRNIALLKFALEQGLRLIWNLLYDIPGERDEWYGEIAELAPLIHHLQPPNFSMIRIDRFSVYHDYPDRYNLRLKPIRYYKYVYPFDDETMSRFVYYFEESGKNNRSGSSRPGRAALIKRILEWQGLFWDFHSKSKNSPKLVIEESSDESLINDTRACTTDNTVRLRGVDHLVYKVCRSPQTETGAAEILEKNYFINMVRVDVKKILNRFVERKLAVNIGDKYLALAVYPPLRHFAKNFRQDDLIRIFTSPRKKEEYYDSTLLKIFGGDSLSK